MGESKLVVSVPAVWKIPSYIAILVEASQQTNMFLHLAFFTHLPLSLRHFSWRCSAGDLSMIPCSPLGSQISLSPATFMLKMKRACVVHWMQSVFQTICHHMFIICLHQFRQAVVGPMTGSTPHKGCQVPYIEQYRTSELFSDIMYFTFATTFLKSEIYKRYLFYLFWDRIPYFSTVQY